MPSYVLVGANSVWCLPVDYPLAKNLETIGLRDASVIRGEIIGFKPACPMFSSRNTVWLHGALPGYLRQVPCQWLWVGEIVYRRPALSRHLHDPLLPHGAHISRMKKLSCPFCIKGIGS